MGAAVAIRADVEAGELRHLARRERDGRVSARLIALAGVLDGMSREVAARAAGMDRQTLRDWVIRFNADGVEGLRDQPRSGRPTRMTEGQQAAFKAMVLRGPDRERDGVSSWRIIDLCRVAERRFGVSYRESGMLRLVKSLNLSWQKVRPSHPKADRGAQARFKKTRCPCEAVTRLTVCWIEGCAGWSGAEPQAQEAGRGGAYQFHRTGRA